MCTKYLKILIDKHRHVNKRLYIGINVFSIDKNYCRNDVNFRQL